MIVDYEAENEALAEFEKRRKSCQQAAQELTAIIRQPEFFDESTTLLRWARIRLDIENELLSLADQRIDKARLQIVKALKRTN